MKTNPTRYSSAVGEIWVMASFKVKYCHKIFDMSEMHCISEHAQNFSLENSDILAVRELCLVLFYEAFCFYGIKWRKIAFDSDHVHMIIDMGLYSKIELAKKLRGFVAKQLFGLIPWLKYSKWEGGYFWGSGLWNPAYDIRSINDMDFYDRYLDKQKYSTTNQKTLTAFN